MTMERANMELHPPHDKYLLVFFTMVLHGIGTLMPWNMFITAKSVSFKYFFNFNSFSPLFSYFFFSTFSISQNSNYMNHIPE